MTLPASVTKVDNDAFKFCISLNRLQCNATVPPETGWRDVFLDVPVDKCELIVPEGSVDDYRLAKDWKEFFNITAGAENIITEPENNDVEYFGVDGIHRNSSDRGLLIRRSGNKTIKIINR